MREKKHINELNWYCFVVKSQVNAKKSFLKKIRRDFKQAFLKDFTKIEILTNDEGLCSEDEWYVFVKCNNYDKYVQSVRRIRYIVRTMGDFENPDVMSDKEVLEFCDSVKKSKTQALLFLGDIVKVLSGYLSGLFGVVNGYDNGKYEVVFRFHTKVICEKFTMSDILHADKNIFHVVRNPIVKLDGGIK